MPKVMSERARRALFAKGKRGRSVALASETKGGPKMPMTSSTPDTVPMARAPKISSLNRKSNSWSGA